MKRALTVSSRFLIKVNAGIADWAVASVFQAVRQGQKDELLNLRGLQLSIELRRDSFEERLHYQNVTQPAYKK